MESIAKLVEGLSGANAAYAGECLQKLTAVSEGGCEAYACFDAFADMMRSDRAALRAGGLRLIAANARWDEDYRIDEVIDEYLKHLADIKPAVARQCIRGAAELARYKPDLQEDVVAALRRVNIFRYKGTIQPLIRQDIDEALKSIRGERARGGAAC